MLIEVTQTDLVRLIRGYQPDYSQMESLKRYGQYYDQRCTWDWNTFVLSKLSEEELYSLYQKLNEPLPKSSWQLFQEDKQKEIDEIQCILDDGIKRGNQGQIKAAQEELERFKRETIS